MALDKCFKTIPLETFVVTSYQPHIDFLVWAPDGCMTVEFLKKLREFYGIKKIFVGSVFSCEYQTALDAGYKIEDIIAGIPCNQDQWGQGGFNSLEELIKWTKTVGHGNIGGIYMDEPDRHCKGLFINEITTVIQNSTIAHNYGLQFIVGSHESHLYNEDIWRRYVPYADAILNTFYDGTIWGYDQIRVQHEMQEAGKSGGISGWINLDYSNAGYRDSPLLSASGTSVSDLLNYAKNNSYKQVWIYGPEVEGKCCGNNDCHGENTPCSDQNSFTIYLERLLNDAARLGMVTITGYMVDRKRWYRCRFEDCNLCDPNRSDHWIPIEYYVGRGIQLPPKDNFFITQRPML